MSAFEKENTSKVDEIADNKAVGMLAFEKENLSKVDEIADVKEAKHFFL